MAEELWRTDLEPTVNGILTGNEPLTFAAHAAVYSKIFNYVAEGKAKGTSEASQAQIYTQVQNFLDEHTKRISAAAPTSDDGELASYYDTEWDHFSSGTAVLNRLLNYLNRHYVLRKRAEGHLNVVTIRNLALGSWRENVLDSLGPRLERIGPNKEQIESIRIQLNSEDLLDDKFKELRITSPQPA
ncbi:CULLIN-2 domain-containing protein [Favolaschia claudopus]|uniref:CULLIN-2 domain-containing protein n=1 Tax=Favolaschia claudopus TaxID=2862362 RepID=A0AAV9ZM25_9AGAR